MSIQNRRITLAKDCYASGRRLYKHLCPLAFGRINFKGGARLLPTAKAGGIRRAYLMMKNGVLKRSKIQETNSQTDTKEIGGGISVFSGKMVDDGTTTVMEENRYVPHDHNVSILLNLLDLEPQETLPAENVTGQLICLKGRLAIRDFKRFTESISVMADNSELFKVNPKDADNAKKTFETMFKIMPINIEAEFVLKDNSVVRGILQEKYLLTAYQDIVATHGTRLSGV